jgi:hypothetical protein
LAVERIIKIGTVGDPKGIERLTSELTGGLIPALDTAIRKAAELSITPVPGATDKISTRSISVDPTGRVAKTVADITRELKAADGTTVKLMSTFTNFSSTIDATARDLGLYSKALTANETALARATAAKKRADAAYKSTPALLEVNRLEKEIQLIENRAAKSQEQLDRGKGPVYIRGVSGSVSRENAPAFIERELESARRLNIEKERILSTDTSIVAARNRQAAADAEVLRLTTQQERIKNRLRYNPPPPPDLAPLPIPTQLQGLPPKVLAALGTAGLDIENYGKFLSQVDKSQAGFFHRTQDVATGLSHLSTGFRDNSEQAQRLKIQWDAAGNVLTALGGKIENTFRILGTGRAALGGVNAITGGLSGLIDAEQFIGRQEITRTLPQLSPETVPGKVLANVPYISGATTTFDTFNDVLRTNYEISIKDSEGLSHLLTTIEKFRSISGVLPELEKLVAVQNQVASSSAAAKAEVDRARAALEAYNASDAITKRNADLDKYRVRQEYLAGQRAAGLTEEAGTNRSLDQAIRANDRRIAQLERQIALDTTLVALNNDIAAAEAAQTRILASNGELLERQRIATANRLATAPLQLPKQIQTLANESPQLLAQFQARGLGRTAKEIYEQGGDSIRIMRDLDLGINRVDGTIRRLDGSEVKLTGAFREGGQVVTSYGRQMSGLSNYLQQTVNNFVKLTQWMAATAILFTGFSVVKGALDNLIAFDAQLKRLSITSQTSSTDIKLLFNQLTDVALRTATPIGELINAADDIALATKRANQSTSEWRQGFLDLANAVGILTNIAGLDTVQATDKLTAIMKQLGLNANELLGVLSKITAVAGGQANAIADITVGLGAMAEAAKQANLSVDQSISVLQVLSQVTGKSSAEIAVAFKNLTGSLGSPGARKVFDQYGILAKTAEGDLRNIIDIYTEINEKIRSGAIAAGDVQAVLRGISGGPRRLPDAAALLANIGQINEVTKQSVNATNEALLANAKILDTIPAKVTQLQNAFQTFIQSNFGDAFKSIVTSIVDIGSGLLDFLGDAPPQLFVTLLSLVPILTAIKIGTIAANAAMGFFRSATASAITPVEGLTIAITQQTAAMRAALPAAQAEILSNEQIAASAERAAARVSAAAAARRAALIRTGAAAGIAGGVSLISSGGDIGAGLEDAALFGGIAAASTGAGPIAIGGAIVAGAAIIYKSFIKDTKDAGEAQRATAQDILQAVTAYQEAARGLEDLNAQQSVNLDLLRQYSEGGEVGAISSGIEQYAAGIRQTHEANKQLEESFNRLLDLSPKIKELFGKDLILARSGGFDTDQLKDLSVKLADKLAQSFYPDYVPLSNPEVPPPVPGTTLSEVVPPELRARAEEYQNALDALIKKQEQYIATTGRGLFIDQVHARELKNLKDSYKDVADVVDNYIGKVADLTTQTKNFVQFQSTLLLTKQYTGLLTPDEFSAGTKNLRYYQLVVEDVMKQARQAVRVGGLGISYELSSTNKEIIKALNEALITPEGNIVAGKVPIDQVRELLEKTGQLQILRNQGVEVTDAWVSALARGLGIEVELIGAAREELTIRELTASQAKVLADLDQQRADILGKIVTSTVPSRGGFVEQLDQAEAVSESVRTFLDFLTSGKGTLEDYRTGLSEVIGLQALAQGTEDEPAITEDKIGQFIGENITRFALSSKAARQFTQDLIDQSKAWQNLVQARSLATDVDYGPSSLIGQRNLSRLIELQNEYDEAAKRTNRTLLESVFANPRGLLAENIYREFQESLGNAGQAALDAFDKMTPNERVLTLETFIYGVKSGLIELTNEEKILGAAVDAANIQLAEQAAALGDLANATSNLYQSLLQGDFAENPAAFTSGLEQAQAIASNRQELFASLSKLSTDPGGELEALEKQLSTLPGLNDAVGLTAQQLTDRLASLFGQFGSSGPQIGSFVDNLINAATAIQTTAGKVPILLDGLRGVADYAPQGVNLRDLEVQFLGQIGSHPSVGKQRKIFIVSIWTIWGMPQLKRLISLILREELLLLKISLINIKMV